MSRHPQGASAVAGLFGDDHIPDEFDGLGDFPHLSDLDLLLSNWTPLACDAAPKPATTLLVALAAPALLRRRRKA